MSSVSTDHFPRVRIKSRRAQPFFGRHPWVFAGAIQSIDGDPAPGDEVVLAAHDGQFIGKGIFNSHSNIRVRMYAWDETTLLDRELWSRRLDDAIDLRKRLIVHSESSACRIVNSEADGLSGLTVDRYGDWLAVQFTSLALAHRRDDIVGLLKEKLQPRGIWLRTEKGIRDAEGLELDDGLLAGVEPERTMFIEENGVSFGIDLCQGQKTGFYCDQRDNRAAIARYCHGQKVLDLFCYSGGFSLAAVKLGGAKTSLGIDSSATAIELAKANAQLNGVAERTRFEQGAVFETLEKLQQSQERFDVVILDPPKMVRHLKGIDKAIRGYHSLNRLAVDVLRPGGILVTCSCTGHVSREMFAQILADVSQRSHRPIQILEARGAAPDHPVSTYCPESEYLKCFICRVL
ncbi:MAG: class I SAM-dependent rRNA methyltransferase [Planctomycetota bacterium]|nr:class I SAM-dependent rRNA methyltransferase [Planctomycetota bacterium]